jgi:hypothetical protein
MEKWPQKKPQTDRKQTAKRVNVNVETGATFNYYDHYQPPQYEEPERVYVIDWTVIPAAFAGLGIMAAFGWTVYAISEAARWAWLYVNRNGIYVALAVLIVSGTTLLITFVAVPLGKKLLGYDDDSEWLV